MKKYIALFLLIVMVILIGCGSNQSDRQQTLESGDVNQDSESGDTNNNSESGDTSNDSELNEEKAENEELLTLKEFESIEPEDVSYISISDPTDVIDLKEESDIEECFKLIKNIAFTEQVSEEITVGHSVSFEIHLKNEKSISFLILAPHVVVNDGEWYLTDGEATYELDEYGCKKLGFMY